MIGKQVWRLLILGLVKGRDGWRRRRHLAEQWSDLHGLFQSKSLYYSGSRIRKCGIPLRVTLLHTADLRSVSCMIVGEIWVTLAKSHKVD